MHAGLDIGYSGDTFRASEAFCGMLDILLSVLMLEVVTVGLSDSVKLRYCTRQLSTTGHKTCWGYSLQLGLL